MKESIKIMFLVLSGLAVLSGAVGFALGSLAVVVTVVLLALKLTGFAFTTLQVLSPIITVGGLVGLGFLGAGTGAVISRSLDRGL